jgi:60 kDa SS-A/Ro ribonucleoprotein
MARVNTARNIPKIYTAEGAPAKHINAEQALRRSVLSCLLWEREFYEDGQDIATRIMDLANHVSPEVVAMLAKEARHVHGLRHAPLLLLLNLVGRPGSGAAKAINDTIKRADEMTELLALYWQKGKRPLAKQLQRGLADAFGRFNEYALAKYDRDGPVKMRDVLFLAHPKPKDDEQAALFKRVADQDMAVPDTWEVNLSGGGSKKETFERLISEGKLGYLALLRNLRNMVEAGCDLDMVKAAIVARKGAELVFPFRYVAAARVVPQLEPALDEALKGAVANGVRLDGKTVVLVDVSGSMDAALSSKSDLKRIDAAATLASVLNADLRVFTFSHQIVEVPPRTGMAGVDAIIRSQPHGGTYLGAAVDALNKQVAHDRLIVITDEQSHDRVPDPIAKHAYMINVASNKNGVGYGKWTHIDGFSEAVIRFIAESESFDRQ